MLFSVMYVNFTCGEGATDDTEGAFTNQLCRLVTRYLDGEVV